MSVGPNPPHPGVDVDQIEQARRQIQKLAQEIAQLSEMELAPAEYYGEFLKRVLQALQAPAGAVWLRTPQGNLQLQYQINMGQVGLDRAENSRQMHNELLRQVHMSGKAALLWPNSSLGPTESGATPAGNPTDYVILLAPILVDKQVAGLVEVWQDPNRGHDAQAGFLNFIQQLSGLAASYTRNHQLRTMVGQEQLWKQLEKFARDIHASLNPTEVGYLVVNEGRRLCECDRVSVAVRSGPYSTVTAISGADVVEKRSNLVQLMRALFDAVLAWGERLVYSGTKDDALPPRVLKALDAYLAESNSKLLVVMPLRDERETNKKKPARSAIMMECFEPAAAPEQMVARLEVVGRHATSALYNSAEYKRIPMRLLWLPLAKVQEGLGGKARFIITLVALGLVALIVCMVFIPYPLKMDAKGQLLPVERAWVFSPLEGQVLEIKEDLKPNTLVGQHQELFRVFSKDLQDKTQELKRDIDTNKKIVDVLTSAQNPSADQKTDLERAKVTYEARRRQLEELRSRVNAIPDRDGEFWIRSPMEGLILTADFRETLKNRLVKPNEPLIRIGKAQSTNLEDWEIELKIPQKHIGQVRAAFGFADKDNELDVDLLLVSTPTATYKGKLHIDKIAREAVPNRNDNNEPEPIVLARVRINSKGAKDIPKDSLVPRDMLLTGVEVHSRIRCGDHAMGYSLFYGVWEFIYEKIVFFF